MNRNDAVQLGRALRLVGEHGDRVEAFDHGPEQLDEVLRDLDAARRLLVAARASHSRTGCRQHPTGPVDPTNGGRCLLCTQYERTGRITLQAGALEEASLAEICAVIAEQGQEAAEARFGPRAVARAVLHCRKDTDLRESA